jgi:hypothetical protein
MSACSDLTGDSANEESRFFCNRKCCLSFGIKDNKQTENLITFSIRGGEGRGGEGRGEERRGEEGREVSCLRVTLKVILRFRSFFPCLGSQPI